MLYTCIYIMYISIHERSICIHVYVSTYFLYFLRWSKYTTVMPLKDY